MDDMVWRNTSKHIVNQALVVSQLNNSNQLSLFSCNKMAASLFNIKSTLSFNQFLTSAKLNIGDSVFNSRLFESLPFKKQLQNLREYLLARHSKMQFENTNNQIQSQIKKKLSSSSNKPDMENYNYAIKMAAAQAANRNNKNFGFLDGTQLNSDPGGKFDDRGGGGTENNQRRGIRKINICSLVSSFFLQAWKKMKLFKNKYSKLFKRKQQNSDSAEDLTTNKGNDADNYLFANNNPNSMENIGNFIDLLDDTPTKSLDVDYLNCSITVKDYERNYRISVFKYKGGPSGEKSPLLILCIDEIKKNDFLNLKEQILEKGHFIFNILEFFSAQLKTQMNFLNDHLKFNYSSHSLQELNSSFDDGEYPQAIEGANGGAGSGSRSYNIAESQDMTSKSLSDINRLVKGIKSDKQQLQNIHKDPHIKYIQPPPEDQNNSPPNTLQQKIINYLANEEGQNSEGALENKYNFLAPPPQTLAIKKTQTLRGNTPEKIPQKHRSSIYKNIDAITKKCETLDISGILNNNNGNNLNKNFTQQKSQQPNQNQIVQININNSNNNIINIQQAGENNNTNQIQNNININSNNIILTNNLNSNDHGTTSKANNNIPTTNNNTQFQKLSPSNKILPSTEDALVVQSDKENLYGSNENNPFEKDQPVLQKDISGLMASGGEQSKEQQTLLFIEAKKIVSEQIIQQNDSSQSNYDYGNNSIDKEMLSQDEIMNDKDRQIFNKHHDKIIKYNKSLIEICHNAKLIALKSLIQVSNYSDCFRHKEYRPLPLRITEFSISELVLNAFYFNSKPVLIYKSKYQNIKSDERRLIQVIFNILNFLLKKTNQSIKFIVMDKEEYDKVRLNQSISKHQHSPNPIDTAKFIQSNSKMQSSNISKNYQSYRGNENINDGILKKKDTNNNLIFLQDINNSDISCNFPSEPTPNVKNPIHNSERGSKIKIQSENHNKIQGTEMINLQKIDKYNHQNSQNSNSKSYNKQNTKNETSNRKDKNYQQSRLNSIERNTDEVKEYSQIQRDTYMLTLGQTVTNNMQSVPKLQIQTNPNDNEDLIDITYNNKINFNDVTPTSNNMHTSNMIMLTNNNTNHNQESNLNISHNQSKNYQTQNKMFDPSNQDEMVLDHELDNDNDYSIAQRIKEKKEEYNKFAIVQLPNLPQQNQNDFPLIQSQDDELFSENYCDYAQNENISNGVQQNVNFHKDGTVLKEIAQGRNNDKNQSHSSDNKNKNQTKQQHFSPQSKHSNSSTKQNNFNNTAASAQSNLKFEAKNTTSFNTNQQQNLPHQPIKNQYFYNNTNFTNVVLKDTPIGSGLASINSSSAKLDINLFDRNKDNFQTSPNKIIQQTNTFFRKKSTIKEDSVSQAKNQDLIFKNLVNISNQNQKKNIVQTTIPESEQNLRNYSVTNVAVAGKGQEISSPLGLGSSQNFSTFQQNPNYIEFQQNNEFQAQFKAKQRSQFSKNPQQYPTATLVSIKDKNTQQIQQYQQAKDMDSGININKNALFSTPIDEDMLKSQNMMNYDSSKNVKVFDEQFKKKSSLKKTNKINKNFSRANSNNSSILQNQSFKNTDTNNVKIYTQPKRISNIGINSKTFHLSPQKANQEDIESNKQTYQYEKTVSIVKHKQTFDDASFHTHKSDVIVIEIQMDVENMKFSPDNNESIQMIATNEIIKLLGPNKKIHIGPNSISFYLYTNLEKCNLETNQISNQEKFEELLNLKELMNPKAVQTIRQMNRAITIDNRTCKTIYTLENKAHNFALVEEENLETHQKQQQEKQQFQLQQQQQNHSDFLSYHSFTKHKSPKINQNNLTRSQAQSYQKNYQKFRSVRQDSYQSGASKSYQTPQLNLQRVLSDNHDSVIPFKNAGLSMEHQLSEQTNKHVKDFDFQSYSQRSYIPQNQQLNQTPFNINKSEKQILKNGNHINSSSKIQQQKIPKDDENNQIPIMHSKTIPVQAATKITNNTNVQSQFQKSFTTIHSKSNISENQ